MLPEGTVPPHTALELQRGLQCPGLIFRFFLGPGAGKGINLRKLFLRKRQLPGIFPLVIFIKIDQIRFPLLQFRDHKSYGCSPVPQMHIAYALISRITADSLDALSDDGRTQMSHMERFRHICPAVVNHNFLRFIGRFQPELRLFPHLFYLFQEKGSGDFQVQETGSHRGGLLKYPALRQARRHIPCDHHGRFPIFLRPCHGAVALIFTQIGAVGQRNPPQGGIIPRRLKGFSHFLRQ